MVISYFGALNAFLAIYNSLPNPIKAFITTSLIVLAGVVILKKVSNL